VKRKGKYWSERKKEGLLSKRSSERENRRESTMHLKDDQARRTRKSDLQEKTERGVIGKRMYT